MAVTSLFTIRIEKPEAMLGETMQEMRIWLGKHMVLPVEFKIERTGSLPNIAFDVRFRSEDEAVLFERIFA
jgi:hypothetical protein